MYPNSANGFPTASLGPTGGSPQSPLRLCHRRQKLGEWAKIRSHPIDEKDAHERNQSDVRSGRVLKRMGREREQRAPEQGH